MKLGHAPEPLSGVLIGSSEQSPLGTSCLKAPRRVRFRKCVENWDAELKESVVWRGDWTIHLQVRRGIPACYKYGPKAKKPHSNSNRFAEMHPAEKDADSQGGIMVFVAACAGGAVGGAPVADELAATAADAVADAAAELGR